MVPDELSNVPPETVDLIFRVSVLVALVWVAAAARRLRELMGEAGESER